MSFNRRLRFTARSLFLLSGMCTVSYGLAKEHGCTPIEALSTQATAHDDGQSGDSPCFNTIDVPGASSTVPSGINSEGDIVGYYLNATGTHGFLLKKGVFNTIDVPGASFTVASGINAQGDIVGSYANATSGASDHGFLLRKGAFTTIDAPLPDTSMPGDTIIYTAVLGIDSRGDIVGIYTRASTLVLNYAFLLSDGVFTTLPWAFGVPNTFPYGINSRGDIVGVSLDNGPPIHGFLLSNGVFTAIAPPVAFSTSAQGINDQGDIVGWSNYPDSASLHGFLLSKGVYTDFVVPGAQDTYANGINSQGDIVGYYQNATGTHGFLVTRNGTVPTAPSNLKAGRDISNPQTQIDLYWQDSSTNESGFQVFRSLDHGVTFSQIGTTGPGATTYQDSGLTPLTGYYYYVQAFNSAGSSAPSNTDWTYTADGTNTSGPIPTAPSNLRAGQDMNNPRTQINVYWQDNSNNEAGFEVFRSSDGVHFSQIGTVPASATMYPNVTEYQNSGLTPGTAYYYYVTAFNPAGSSAPSNTDWTVTAP
jgi:uncharacterized membrane protein